MKHNAVKYRHNPDIASIDVSKPPKLPKSGSQIGFVRTEKINNGQQTADLVVTTDPQGRMVMQHRVREQNILFRMLKKGNIDEDEYLAGEHYVRIFHAARLDASFAASSWSGINGTAKMGMRTDPSFRMLNVSERAIEARKRIDTIEKMVGAVSGSVLRNVLGMNMSLADWAHRVSSGEWPHLTRHISGHQAMGILVSCLGCMAAQSKFGFSK
ncbi:hypothetical protein UFOVP413_12 [uncultured Caudovirales phage]|uniref:Uncharacterized protein n=1 Tax=uncultured Caudovirales phage TaxID=2100421 RepID=A0A6J5M273_9CAUD|nr:hypothetical protein UFOVP413_12 [uncultured Caudovirales phage]